MRYKRFFAFILIVTIFIGSAFYKPKPAYAFVGTVTATTILLSLVAACGITFVATQTENVEKAVDAFFNANPYEKSFLEELIANNVDSGKLVLGAGALISAKDGIINLLTKVKDYFSTDANTKVGTINISELNLNKNKDEFYKTYINTTMSCMLYVGSTTPFFRFDYFMFDEDVGRIKFVTETINPFTGESTNCKVYSGFTADPIYNTNVQFYFDNSSSYGIKFRLFNPASNTYGDLKTTFTIGCSGLNQIIYLTNGCVYAPNLSEDDTVAKTALLNSYAKYYPMDYIGKLTYVPYGFGADNFIGPKPTSVGYKLGAIPGGLTQDDIIKKWGNTLDNLDENSQITVTPLSPGVVAGGLTGYDSAYGTQEKPGVITGISDMPFADTDAPDTDAPGTDAPDLDDIGEMDGYMFDLKGIFPFCLPFDFIDFVGILSAEPETPSITWTMPLPYNINGGGYTFNINLERFNGVAEIMRKMETISFIVGLVIVTRSRFLRG